MVPENVAEGTGGGIDVGVNSSLFLTNSMLWGNEAGGITDEDGQVNISGGMADVNHTCVQGWTGSLGGLGNTGSNPVFMEVNGADDVPGTYDDNVWILPGSPCIDAGDNTAVPPDENDLDEDGDTTEPIPWDLDGKDRFVAMMGPGMGPM